MGAYKPKNAYEYNNTNYDEKSSDHGHYEPEITGKRYGRDGSMAPVTQMRWVEDNRSFEAPDAAPEAPEAPPMEPVAQSEIPTSDQVSKAQDLVDSYTSGIITGSNSPYKTNIESPTPNMNTQGPNVLGAFETNTFSDPAYTSDTAKTKAADSFLQAKKLELGAGLNLS